MDPLKTPPFAQPFAEWQKAAIDASLTGAKTALESAEQLLRLNLATARAALDQQTQLAQEILSVKEPQQLEALRAKLAQTSLQQAANYAQAVGEIVNESRARIATLAQQQMAQLDEGTRKAAGAIGQGAPGTDTALNTMQSAMAASSAMLDSLSRASRQFADNLRGEHESDHRGHVQRHPKQIGLPLKF